MRQYMKSEFYRVFHSYNSYIFIGVCSLLLLSSNVVLASVKYMDKTFPYATTYFSFANLYASFLAIYLLCVMIASMIFGNEYGNRTLKNSVSYGISRGAVYFGKLLVEVIYAGIAFVIISGVHLTSAYLLLENSGQGNLVLFFKTTFLCFPLLLFAIGASNCFIFLFDSTGTAISAIMGLLVALPLVSNLLGMKFDAIQKFADILPFNMIRNIDFDFHKLELILKWNENTWYYYWMSGIIQMVIVVMAGFIIFNKREIK